MTSIEWTDETLNVAVGCTRVSEGCRHCYAERVVHRQMQDAHKGLTVVSPDKGPRWNGTVRLMPERLATPLRWRKPRRVFVGSLMDYDVKRDAYDRRDAGDVYREIQWVAEQLPELAEKASLV